MADDVVAWDGRWVVRRGDEWSLAFLVEEATPGTGTGPSDPPVYRPVDLTGRAARMQVRPDATSDLVILELTSSDGTAGGPPHIRIQPDPATWPALAELVGAEPGDPLLGWVWLYIGGSETAGLDRGGKFDVEVYDPTNPDATRTVLDGELIVNLDITR